MRGPSPEEVAEMKRKAKKQLAPVFKAMDDRHQKVKEMITEDMKEAFATGLLVGYLYGRKK